MSKIQIVSDGSCDLTAEQIINNDIIVVPFYVSFDGNQYLKEGVDIGVRDFYQRMVDESSVYPKTSLPSVDDYFKVFEPLIQEGRTIICICITTKFSGSYNSAMSAKELILENYPTAEIHIVDAMVNTCLQGLLVLETCRMRDDGLEAPAIIQNIERIRLTGRIYFVIGNLEYLRRGGRIGKLVGLVGSALRIKPLIVLKEGEIFSAALTFTRKKAISKILELTQRYFEDEKENPQNFNFVTGYGYDIQEGENFNKHLMQVLKVEGINTAQIGATIAVHTGPYPLGVGLIKRYDA